MWRVRMIDTALGSVRVAWVESDRGGTTSSWARFFPEGMGLVHLGPDGTVELPGRSGHTIADVIEACELAAAILAACLPGVRS